MIVTPLVISSIILGICSSDNIDYLKNRVSYNSLFYFHDDHFGVNWYFLTLIIEPGAYINSTLSSLP